MFILWTFLACIHTCIPCVSDVHECQKTISDPLELSYGWLRAGMWILGPSPLLSPSLSLCTVP